MNEKERMQEWKWARKSNAAETAREIESNFLFMVRERKKLALLKKEELKRKKTKKTMKILNECKLHGGPLTPDSLILLNELTET